MLTYFQAIILGIIQGITEPFPISSLGHNVLVPDLLGWHNIVNSEPKSESFFLSFLVALHVATALALLLFYRRTWYKLVAAFFSSVKHRSIKTSHERMVWLLILATIPAGIVSLALEHALRTQFAKPLSAAVFLVINGFILLAGDRLATGHRRGATDTTSSIEHTARTMTVKQAATIGVAQVFALIAGISRSGITMVGGLYSGLDYEDSARFSFFLATPIILAAGFYKLPDLLGPNGNGVRSQVLVGAIFAFIACYFTIRYLDRYFQTKRLRPFAIYCLVFGLFMIGFNIIKG